MVAASTLHAHLRRHNIEVGSMRGLREALNCLTVCLNSPIAELPTNVKVGTANRKVKLVEALPHLYLYLLPLPPTYPKHDGRCWQRTYWPGWRAPLRRWRGTIPMASTWSPSTQQSTGLQHRDPARQQPGSSQHHQRSLVAGSDGSPAASPPPCARSRWAPWKRS